MKKLALFTSFAFFLAACGSNTDAPASKADRKSIKDVHVAAPAVLSRISGVVKGEPINIAHAGDKWRLEGRAMVSAAHPEAVVAGIKILEQGGHAVDAAIAVHAVLGLVEPQSSGLGGGGFMMVYDRASGDVFAYDGRETAPMAARPDMFMESDKKMGFLKAWQSGRSVGVPSVVALYDYAHQRHGKTDWQDLFQHAETLARDGFSVSEDTAGMLPRFAQFTRLDENPETKDYFFPEGKPIIAGAVLKNPEYASTIQTIATKGAGAFYSGEIAEGIIASTTKEPLGGSLGLNDLKNYQPILRTPSCSEYRSYKLCTMAPPSSGIAVGEILGLLEHLGDEGIWADEGDSAPVEKSYMWRDFVDAQRLAYADRDHYFGDGDFIELDHMDFANPDYVMARAKDRFAPDEPVYPGDPGDILRGEPIIGRWGHDGTKTNAGTTHFSIVDFEGNAVSMTATIESGFGSSRMTNGFLLNNELTDFSFEPTKNGKPVANAVAPGKRPRSSMSPSFLFDEKGDLFMVTGSPGGNSIIAYTAKSILGVVDMGLSAEEAAALPNVIARGNQIRVETAFGGEALVQSLNDMGYDVKPAKSERSGLHIIIAREDRYEGAADPRRGGSVSAISQ